MDSRRSIHSCRGAGCGRRDVGLGAAGKTPVEGGAAVTNRPVEMLTFQTDAENDTAAVAKREWCGLTLRRRSLSEERLRVA